MEVICGTGVGCTFIAYGADRQRVAKWEYEEGGSSSDPFKVTHYVNGLEFEYEHDTAPPAQPSDAQTIRRPVAGGGLELLERFGSAMLARMQVLHSDHLGSIVAVSDANGQIEARMAFDAWGQRRDPWSDAAWLQWTDLRPVWADAMLTITPRGFTGHEHLDRHGLIHMNGRVYDPRLGRFLQADPFIEDTSTLNRYTYVLNNPLSYSDPSGYFSFKDFARLAFSVTLSFYTQTWVTQLAELSNYAGAIGVAAASGAVAGGVNSGTWDGALSGAFTAVASFGIGQGLEAGRFAGNFAGELNPTGFALKIGAHGVVGGVAAELQGGKFGHGFLSSGVTAAFSPAIHNPDGNTLMQTALAAMIGGTVSEISGGSFANGAVTAAMQFALNQALEVHQHTKCQMNCHGVDYSQHRPATEDELFWLNVTAIAVDLAVPLPPLFSVTKSTVMANKVRGDAFRDEIADLMRKEGRDVQTEITKKTPFGKRVIDIEVSKDGKILGGIETKTGKSRYIPAQRAKDEWLRQNGYPVDLVRDH